MFEIQALSLMIKETEKIRQVSLQKLHGDREMV